jgi:hypothetical protein
MTLTISENGRLKLRAEAERLLSIAEYWVRLADNEDSDQSTADLDG